MPHRSKNERPRISARRNKKGVVKMDCFCPSRMMCKSEENGAFVVTYIESHNHTPDFIDTEHHPMPTSIREKFEDKIQLGCSVDHLFKELRGGKDLRENRKETDDIQKKHTITKRQLKAIARKLKKNKHLHADDATSLDMLIDSLKDEKFNPVLCYKQQGQKHFKVSPPNPGQYNLREDDFLLGIQTKEQLAMFQKRASEIICLDSTHSTNKYDSKLITLVVPDEFGKDYVVGHLICNREDKKNLFHFFMLLNIDVMII